jgi:hypothetical protein
MPFTAGRGRVTGCEQRGNGMVLCESNNSIVRLEMAGGMLATCQRSASCCYHTEFQEGCYQKHTNRRCRWPVWNKGHGTVAAGEWHGMCESAFSGVLLTLRSPSPNKARCLPTYCVAHTRVQPVPVYSRIYYNADDLSSGLGCRENFTGHSYIWCCHLGAYRCTI